MVESTLLSRLCDIGVPARTVGPTMIPDLLRSNGYVIFDRLLSEDTLERISEELEPSFGETECCPRDFYGRNSRISSVLLKSPSSRPVAMHPIMLCIAQLILGTHCELFQLSVTQGVCVYPGRRQQLPHRDDVMWTGEKNGSESLVSVIWALTDFTVENGAPMLWPRSHINCPSHQFDPVEPVVAEMPVARRWCISVPSRIAAAQTVVPSLEPDSTSAIAWAGSSHTRACARIHRISRSSSPKYSVSYSVITIASANSAATKRRTRVPCSRPDTLRRRTQYRRRSHTSWRISPESPHGGMPSPAPGRGNDPPAADKAWGQ